MISKIQKVFSSHHTLVKHLEAHWEQRAFSSDLDPRVRNAEEGTMEDVEHCCVCLELYTHNRQPVRLACSHHLCRLCLASSEIVACPLCRRHVGSLADLPVDSLLLSLVSKGNNSKMAPSPTSFPIGMLDDVGADDAPGTPPYPSAPALVEIQPCMTDDEGPSRRGTAGSSSLNRSSGGSGGSSSSSGNTSSSIDVPLQPTSSSRLGPQPGSTCAEPSRAAPPSSSQVARTTERALITRTSDDAAAPAGSARGWRPRLPFSPRSSSNSPGSHTPRSSSGSSITRQASTLQQGLPRAASTGSQQQAVLSFPVQDLDPMQDEPGLQDSMRPGSPRSWPMQGDNDDSPDAAAAAAGMGTGRRAGAGGSSRSRSRDKQGGSGRRRSSGVYASTHAAVQALVGGAACVLQQLAVPWGGLLDHEGLRRGWAPSGALPHTSVVVATVHSSIYCWGSYSSALQRSLKACRTAQAHTQDAMEGMCRRLGLPGYGQLAWWWVATWLLGFLLHHWQLGLQLLPIAAASLALSAVAGMQPPTDSSSGSSSSSANSGSSSSSANSGSSSCSSSWSLPVWPSKAAGCFLAADCCIVGLLLCLSQQTGLGSGLLLGLLAATPVLLAVVVLLLCGQVVVDVLCRGWWGHGELRHASLLCRCWCVVAAGVLAAGGVVSSSGGLSSTLATAAAWVQKLHMLLVEGPVLVLHLGSLLQAGESSARAGAAALAYSSGSSSSASAPAACSSRAIAGSSSSRRTPPAAAATAPAGAGAGASSRGGGAAAVLCCLHFLLQLLVLLFVPPGPLAAATWLPQHLQGCMVWAARVMLCGVAVQLVLRAVGGTPEEAAAAGPAAAAGLPALPGGVWGGAGRLSSGSSSCQQGLLGHSSSSGSGCAAGPSCSSPGPHSRRGWELQLHAGHGSSCGGVGGGCSSHDLWGGESQGSWALAARSSSGSGDGDLSVGAGFMGGMGLLGSGDGGSSSVAAGVYRLLWQHAPYLLLLVAAGAGDTFITAAAAPASAAAVVLAIRMAWHRCLQCCMVAALGLEVAAAARREVVLLLQLPLLTFGRGSGSGGSNGFGVAGRQQAAPVW